MKHTMNMPWDDIWDFSYYRVTKVRMIIKRYKLISVRRPDENKYRRI